MNITLVESAVIAFASTTGATLILHTLVKKGIEEAVKLNFDKRLEYFKHTLTNSEEIFIRQLKSLTQLRKLFREISPKRSHPNMDWSDACDEMALAFSYHAEKLDDFICSYASILPKNVAEMLETASVLASENAIELEWGTYNLPDEVPTIANKAADKMHKHIKDAITEFQKIVDSKATYK